MVLYLLLYVLFWKLTQILKLFTANIWILKNDFIQLFSLGHWIIRFEHNDFNNLFVIKAEFKNLKCW